MALHHRVLVRVHKRLRTARNAIIVRLHRYAHRIATSEKLLHVAYFLTLFAESRYLYAKVGLVIGIVSIVLIICKEES